MLEKIFHLRENNTNLNTEVRAGVVTFITMCYIIFVQPGLLEKAGMDPGAVLVATCLSAALATLIMGLYANYPICQAPLMGENFFFVFTVVIGMNISWQVALGAVFISGLVFLLLTLIKVRELIIDVIPQCLKGSIAVGIGMFITLIGLHLGGIIKPNPSTLVQLGNFREPVVLLCFFGLLIIIIMLSAKIKGAFLWGMLITTLTGWFTGLVQYRGVIKLPPSLEPTLLKLDIAGVFNNFSIIVVAIVFLFMLMFDTIGTLIGVSEHAEFIKEGKLPRANKALVSDAVGTIAGSILGTSTVSSYIESAAGISEGGRTGLANMITALLFLLALFFSPLVMMIGGGIKVGTSILYPVTAPVMILVGSMMIKNVVKIQWEDTTEAIPAFLTIIGIPFTYSIVEGIAFGFISYPIVKIFSGQGKKVSWLVYLLGVLFLLRYIFIKI